MNGQFKSGLQSLVAGGSVFVAFAIVWHLAVSWSGVHPVLLPSPLRVLQTAWQERVTLALGFWETGRAALLGLGGSIVVGSVTAILFSQSRWVRTAFYPYVIFLQTVPIVAIAPLLITWCGYNLTTVILVAMIISLFPIVSNVTAGLISVDEDLKDLFRLHHASRWQTLVKLRIPFAVSHLVLGVRVSAGLAVIGAIVGEFFVGMGSAGYAGLGTLLTAWQNLVRTDALIAVVFASTLLGLLVLGLVNFVARVLLGRWTRGGGFEIE